MKRQLYLVAMVGLVSAASCIGCGGPKEAAQTDEEKEKLKEKKTISQPIPENKIPDGPAGERFRAMNKKIEMQKQEAAGKGGQPAGAKK